jgi:hypothetical protein
MGGLCAWKAGLGEGMGSSNQAWLNQKVAKMEMSNLRKNFPAPENLKS